MSTELETERTPAKRVVHNDIAKKTLGGPSSVCFSEETEGSSHLPLTEGHNFQSLKIVSCLPLRADSEPHFYTFHSNSNKTSKYTASIQIFEPWQGNTALPSGHNGAVMSYSEWLI